MKSRRKGRKYEQSIAGFYRELGCSDVQRGWQSRLGSDNPDVRVPALRDFWIECKHHQRVGKVSKWWSETRDAIGERPHKVILHVHETNGPDLVLLDLHTWKIFVELFLKNSVDTGEHKTEPKRV